MPLGGIQIASLQLLMAAAWGRPRDTGISPVPATPDVRREAIHDLHEM